MREMTETNEQPTAEGWWPDEARAPICQWFSKADRRIAQVVKQGTRGWRAFSMLELNKNGTSAKPLADTVLTREEAKQQCEAYATTMYPEGERK
jgi:hypothetical protein